MDRSLPSDQNSVTFREPPKTGRSGCVVFISICRTSCAIPRCGAGSTLAQWPFLLLLLNYGGVVYPQLTLGDGTEVIAARANVFHTKVLFPIRYSGEILRFRGGVTTGGRKRGGS